MSAHLATLATRRGALCGRSAVLRDELRDEVRAVGARFASADRLVATARSGKMRALLIGVAALVVIGRPRRVLKFALRTLALWPMISIVLPQLRRLFSSAGSDPEPSA